MTALPQQQPLRTSPPLPSLPPPLPAPSGAALPLKPGRRLACQPQPQTAPAAGTWAAAAGWGAAGCWARLGLPPAPLRRRGWWDPVQPGTPCRWWAPAVAQSCWEARPLLPLLLLPLQLLLLLKARRWRAQGLLLLLPLHLAQRQAALRRTLGPQLQRHQLLKVGRQRETALVPPLLHRLPARACLLPLALLAGQQQDRQLLRGLAQQVVQPLARGLPVPPPQLVPRLAAGRGRAHGLHGWPQQTCLLP